MTKPVITTRATKGSALTWSEGDANLENLRDATISVSDGTNTAAVDLNGTFNITAGTGISVEVNATTDTLTITNTQSAGATTLDGLSDVNTSGVSNNHVLKYNSTATEWQSALLDIPTNLDSLTDVSVSGPSDGQVLKYNSAMTRWENGTATGGITSVSQDTNPQLGGNLDVNGKTITSVSNGNITITPNGTGSVVLDGLNWPQADGTSNQVLKTDGSGQLSWGTIGALNSNLNYAQAGGGARVSILSSASFPADIISVSITTNGGPVLINAYGDAENTGPGYWSQLQLYRGTTAIGSTVHTEGSAGSENSPFSLNYIDNPSAGTYTYYLKANNISGGTINFGENTAPTINVTELKGIKGETGATGSTGAAGADGATTLDALNDVVITAAATGDILRFDGTNWVDTAESSITVGTATNATNAANIGIASTDGNTSDTAMSVVLVGAQSTGNQAPHIDAGLTYNASTNALTATTFIGALSGNATTATTATTANNVSISTTTGNTSDTLVYIPMVPALSTGSQALHLDSTLSYNASTGALTATSFVGALTGDVTGNVTGNSDTVTITADNTTNATNYPLFVNAVSGSLGPKTDTSYTWNPFTNTLNLGTQISAAGTLSLASTAATGYSALITTSASQTATYTLTLPTNAGTSGYVLSTNGTGTLSWVSRGTGTVTSVGGTGTVNGLTLTGSVTTSGNLTLGGTLSLATAPAIGSTSANTGAFTTLSASSTVSGTGFSTYLASPPAIGGTAAAAITGTTITANTGFAGALNGTVGATTANTGAFTTISATGAITSTVATGTAPFTVASTTKVTNLNVEQVDGYHADTANTVSTIAVRDGSGIITASGFAGALNGTVGGTTPTTGAFTSITSSTSATLKDIRETVYTGGTTTGTITPDVANGSIQKITLTGSITFNAFANPVAGQSMTLIITQSAAGGLTLTSTMKFSGGSKTLSTAANAVDILSVFYDGTTYWASLGKAFA